MRGFYGGISSGFSLVLFSTGLLPDIQVKYRIGSGRRGLRSQHALLGPSRFWRGTLSPFLAVTVAVFLQLPYPGFVGEGIQLGPSTESSYQGRVSERRLCSLVYGPSRRG